MRLLFDFMHQRCGPTGERSEVAQMAQIVQGLGRIEGQRSADSGGANGANWLKSHTHAFEFPDDFFPHLPLSRKVLETQQPTQSSFAEKADLFGIAERSEELLNVRGESQQAHHLRDPSSRNALFGCDLRSRQGGVVFHFAMPFEGEMDQMFDTLRGSVPASGLMGQQLSPRNRVGEGMGDKRLGTPSRERHPNDQIDVPASSEFDCACGANSVKIRTFPPLPRSACLNHGYR
jgi:hypothetical protein